MSPSAAILLSLKPHSQKHTEHLQLSSIRQISKAVETKLFQIGAKHAALDMQQILSGDGSVDMCKITKLVNCQCRGCPWDVYTGKHHLQGFQKDPTQSSHYCDLIKLAGINELT